MPVEIDAGEYGPDSVNFGCFLVCMNATIVKQGSHELHKIQQIAHLKEPTRAIYKLVILFLSVKKHRKGQEHKENTDHLVLTGAWWPVQFLP